VDRERQKKMPLLQAMRVYADSGVVGFHTPGHKQGKGIHRSLRDLVTPLGWKMEVSLMDELDDLHEPTMCIKEAQDLAADLYGADATYFIINGTTGAIHAMILAALRPGEKIIVPRNAHRSIMGGIMLSGAIPIFIQPEIDVELGIAMGIATKNVAAAIEMHPDAKAVLIINPTYYGVASDLQAIADVVHDKDMILLVDEAHGPHLKFNAALPMQALDAGADIVAQSTHKIIGSMTQSSMLHVKYGRIQPERVRTMVSLVQSTSPNYLLLGSLDAARMQMAESGLTLIGQAVDLANWIRREITQIKGLHCFGLERMHRSGAYALDVTKITVTVRDLGISGACAEHILRHTYKIQCELSDVYNVLFIISLGDSKVEARLLVKALQDLAASQQHNIERFTQPMVLPKLPIQKLAPREALFADTADQLFDTSEGCVSGEVITFYPPGIPVICPGEEITKEIIDYVRAMQKIGLKIVGPQDAALKMIKIIK